MCKPGTVQLSRGMGAGMGVGRWGQVSLPRVFRLAALLTDIYCTVHHTHQASTSEGLPIKLRLSKAKKRSERRRTTGRLYAPLLKSDGDRESKVWSRPLMFTVAGGVSATQPLMAVKMQKAR